MLAVIVVGGGEEDGGSDNAVDTEDHAVGDSANVIDFQGKINRRTNNVSTDGKRLMGGQSANDMG